MHNILPPRRKVVHFAQPWQQIVHCDRLGNVLVGQRTISYTYTPLPLLAEPKVEELLLHGLLVDVVLALEGGVLKPLEVAHEPLALGPETLQSGPSAP